MSLINFLSDLHLNTCSSKVIDEFMASLKERDGESLIITGDITDGLKFADCLKNLAKALPNSPIYFVLGNHDYYDTGTIEAELVATQISEEMPNLHYLTSTSPIS